MSWVWLTAAAGLLALRRPSVALVRVTSAVRGRGQPRDRSGPPVAETSGVRGGWDTWPMSTGLRPNQFRAAAATCAVGVLAITVVVGGRVATGLAGAVVVLAAYSSAHRRVVDRAAARDDRDLVQALGLIEAELSAGAPEGAALVAAAGLAGAHRAALSRAGATARRGGDVAAALTAAGSAPALAGLAAAWHVRAACGAPLAEVVGRVRHDVEQRAVRTRDVAVALAGPRSSGGLLTALPVVGLGLGSAMGAHPARFLFTTAGGSAVLLVGVLADVAGTAWLAGLVRRAQR